MSRAPDDTDDSQTKPAPISSANGNGGDQRSLADGETAQVEEKEYEDFRATGFANKHELSRWFPQIEFDERKSWRIWLSKRSRALLINTTVVGAILLANFALTVFAASRYTSSNGVAIIYEGDCDTVKNLSLWIHLLINLLGTSMLSASNYCMQLQRERISTKLTRTAGGSILAFLVCETFGTLATGDDFHGYFWQ